jgi:phosphatidylglycerol---prolipoprotein diacylglyceryl transferase
MSRRLTTTPMIFALPFPPLDPVILEIGPFSLRWYALAYVMGIVLGWIYAARLIDNDRLWPQGSPMSRAALDDFIVWATLGIVLGGRIGYVLFYNPGYYLNHPGEALALWQGGMAFHGGFLGTTLVMVLFARARGIPFLSLTDIVSASVPFGLLFGRIANFINGELYGRPSEVPWAVIFPRGGPEPRHPSQLYEAALEGVVLFLVLRLLTHRLGALGRPGLVTGAFVAGYGAARFLVEFFRMPDAQIGLLPGGVTMGQILSLPMIIAGLAVIVYALRHQPVSGVGRVPGSSA